MRANIIGEAKAATITRAVQNRTIFLWPVKGTTSALAEVKVKCGPDKLGRGRHIALTSKRLLNGAQREKRMGLNIPHCKINEDKILRYKIKNLLIFKA